MKEILDLVNFFVWLLQVLVTFGIPIFLVFLALVGIKLMAQREILMGIYCLALLWLYFTFLKSFGDSYASSLLEPGYLPNLDPITGKPESWLDIHSRISVFATGMTSIFAIIFAIILQVVGGFVGGFGKAIGMMRGKE